MKGATLEESASGKGSQISIHAPVKGATDDGHGKAKALEISIHAPVKGATQNHRDSDRFSEISIHAPVKGATVCEFAPFHNSPYFNSRSREGSDSHGTWMIPSMPRFQSTLP